VAGIVAARNDLHRPIDDQPERSAEDVASGDFNLVDPFSDAQAEAYADQALHLFLNGCSTHA